MNFLQRINNSIAAGQEEKGLTITGFSRGYADPVYFPQVQQRIGGTIELYPNDNGERYVNKGYNLNDAVYSIVSKCAKKFGQVPFYHIKIKKDQRKTWAEYLHLTKNGITREMLPELKMMRKSSIDENAVDSPLSKRLANPNRYQSGSAFREQLYGFKLLHGEGNHSFIRPLDDEGNMLTKGKVLEMLILPKPFLSIVGDNNDPWEIVKYVFRPGGSGVDLAKVNVVMWKFPNYKFDAINKTHLRGQAPLEAGIVLLQSLNEGNERAANMNKNAGAAGLLFNKSVANQAPDPAKAAAVRQQINSIVNSKESAGSIASIYGGDWQYLQFGFNADQLKLIEQYNLGFTRLCNMFDCPPGIFMANQTYENAREAKRSLVYENIAPAAYQLRDEWNNSLIDAFELDRDTNFIDCDIMALPELTSDLKEQVAALKDAHWLSVDEKRKASGYEEIGGDAGAAMLVPSGVTTLSDAVAPIGDPLPNND
jgi:HK97 family phage portal protein